MQLHQVLRVIALASVIAASGCASGGYPGGPNAGGPTSPSVFTSSPPQPAMSSTHARHRGK